MAFTHHPDPKPCSVGCRLKKEDYAKFHKLTLFPGTKQRVIENFILDYIEKNHIGDESLSLLQHIQARIRIEDHDFSTVQRCKLRTLAKKGYVKTEKEGLDRTYWQLTPMGEVALK